MANLVIDPLDVAPVEVIEQKIGVSGEPINAGQPVRRDPTSGRWMLARATTATNARERGVSITTCTLANMPITVIAQGLIDLGDALSALNYGVDVFLSDTPGTLADAAGTVSAITGTVEAGHAASPPDKLLRVRL